jgi:hypothetical protein
MISSPTTASLVRTASDDVQEMLAIARSALLNHQHGLALSEGRNVGEAPLPLTIHELDRFDDLSAIYGISPIAGVHVEGQPVDWRVCELVVLASMHVVKHGFLRNCLQLAAENPRR